MYNIYIYIYMNPCFHIFHNQIFADASCSTEHIGQFVGLVLAESFEATETPVLMGCSPFSLLISGF